MLSCKVHFEGTKEEVTEMLQDLLDCDKSLLEKVKPVCNFELNDDPDDPQISNVEEVEEMAQSLITVAPNAKFSFIGSVENHDEYMDFEIQYDSKKLTKRVSGWYISYFICGFNYENYEDFCCKTGLRDKVSREQFDEWLIEECDVALVDGKVYKKAPLSEPIELPSEELGCCPVCGEQLDHITPIIIAEDGKKYHIWCAEEAGIDGEMW